MRFKQVKSEVRQFREIGWRVVHGWRYGRGFDDVSWVSELEYCMSGQFPLRDAFWSVAESYQEETGRPVPLTIVAWHLAMTVKNCPLHSFRKDVLKCCTCGASLDTAQLVAGVK